MLLCGFRGANAHTYTRCKYLPCVATGTCWVPLKSQVSIRAPAENAAEKRPNRSRVPLSHCNDTHIHMDESMDAACVGAGDTCTHACLMHSVTRRCPGVSLAVGPRGAAGAARARPRRRQRARGACWRAFCCGTWGCARPLTGVVCCCCALLRRAGFRNVADEQQRRQWGRDLPIILPVGARRVHRLNPFQQHGAMTGVGSGALAL